MKVKSSFPRFLVINSFSPHQYLSSNVASVADDWSKISRTVKRGFLVFWAPIEWASYL